MASRAIGLNCAASTSPFYMLTHTRILAILWWWPLTTDLLFLSIIITTITAKSATSPFKLYSKELTNPTFVCFRWAPSPLSRTTIARCTLHFTCYTDKVTSDNRHAYHSKTLNTVTLNIACLHFIGKKGVKTSLCNVKTCYLTHVDLLLACRSRQASPEGQRPSIHMQPYLHLSEVNKSSYTISLVSDSVFMDQIKHRSQPPVPLQFRLWKLFCWYTRNHGLLYLQLTGY